MSCQRLVLRLAPLSFRLVVFSPPRSVTILLLLLLLLRLRLGTERQYFSLACFLLRPLSLGQVAFSAAASDEARRRRFWSEENWAATAHRYDDDDDIDPTGNS